MSCGCQGGSGREGTEAAPPRDARAVPPIEETDVTPVVGRSWRMDAGRSGYMYGWVLVGRLDNGDEVFRAACRCRAAGGPCSWQTAYLLTAGPVSAALRDHLRSHNR